MRKSILSLAVAAAVLVPGLAAAQAAAPSPLTGNTTLITDYRFRGISQTFQKPAFQGGFDYAHASGLYAGNWNSNVSQGAGFPGGNIEMDFYGGYKRAFGDLGLDVGFFYYYYPGTKAGATTPFSPVNNKTGEGRTVETPAVFSFIGAVPRTDWLPPEIDRDAKGFVQTGPALAKSPHWTARRQPFLLETSRAGVFAAGDVRSGSVKRVASAVGEGAMAVQFVHEYLKEM